MFARMDSISIVPTVNICNIAERRQTCCLHHPPRGKAPHSPLQRGFVGRASDGHGSTGELEPKGLECKDSPANTEIQLNRKPAPNCRSGLIPGFPPVTACCAPLLESLKQRSSGPVAARSLCLELPSGQAPLTSPPIPPSRSERYLRGTKPRVLIAPVTTGLQALAGFAGLGS